MKKVVKESVKFNEKDFEFIVILVDLIESEVDDWDIVFIGF